MSKVLKKGVYELVDYDGNKLTEPRNGLYLKKYYAYAYDFSCIIVVYFCKWSFLVSVSNIVSCCFRCIWSDS